MAVRERLRNERSGESRRCHEGDGVATLDEPATARDDRRNVSEIAAEMIATLLKRAE